MYRLPSPRLHTQTLIGRWSGKPPKLIQTNGRCASTLGALKYNNVNPSRGTTLVIVGSWVVLAATGASFALRCTKKPFRGYCGIGRHLENVGEVIRKTSTYADRWTLCRWRPNATYYNIQEFDYIYDRNRFPVDLTSFDVRRHSRDELLIMPCILELPQPAIYPDIGFAVASRANFKKVGVRGAKVEVLVNRKRLVWFRSCLP
jgi:hypothetical protein